jgi:hypothetical protein
MTIDYTPLIDALNRHSAALEAYISAYQLGDKTDAPATPVLCTATRKKKAAPAPATEPEQPAAPEQTPEGATLITYQAPEPEQPAAPEPEPEQPATDDHGITYEQIQAATKPLTVIPEAVAEWKDYLLANHNTRVSRGVEEKHYPALLAKAEELKAKYL